MKCYVRATASMPQIVKLVEKRGTVSRRWHSRGCREWIGQAVVTPVKVMLRHNNLLLNEISLRIFSSIMSICL